MHASMQNASFDEWKVPIADLASPAKGAKFSGGPIENSAVSEYCPGLSKANPMPSFSEMILFAETLLYCPSTVKSEGEYSLLPARFSPCHGTSLPSGPIIWKLTNSFPCKRLTKIGCPDRL